MAAPRIVLIDDRLLIEELLVGLRRPRRRAPLHTTSYWYYRACRAATIGAGGHLSGPFEQLAPREQSLAVRALLELRDDVGLPDARTTVRLMVDVASRHPRLNLLNLEVVAVSRALSARVWLSEASAAGVLPAVLAAEDIPWDTVALT